MSSLIAGAAPLLPHASLLQVAGMRMSGCEVGMKDRPRGKAPWRVLRVSGPWRPLALQALLAALLLPEAVAEGRLVPDCIDIHGGPGALTAEAVAGCSALTALPALSLCPPPGGLGDTGGGLEALAALVPQAGALRELQLQSFQVGSTYGPAGQLPPWLVQLRGLACLGLPSSTRQSLTPGPYLSGEPACWLPCWQPAACLMLLPAGRLPACCCLPASARPPACLAVPRLPNFMARSPAEP